MTQAQEIFRRLPASLRRDMTLSAKPLTGNSYEVYFLTSHGQKRAALRLAKGHAGQKVKREVAILKSLEEAGFSDAPSVLACGTYQEKAWMLTQYLPGVPGVNPPLELAKKHIEVLAKLHSLPLLPKTWVVPLKPLYQRLTELVDPAQWGEAGEAVATWVQRNCTNPSGNTCLTHGDCGATNTLWDGHSVKLIDWEWAGPDDYVRDLVYLGGEIWHKPWYNHFSRPLIATLVKHYCALTDANLPEVWERWWGWQLVERLSSATYFAATRPVVAANLRAQIVAWIKANPALPELDSALET